MKVRDLSRMKKTNKLRKLKAFITQNKLLVFLSLVLLFGVFLGSSIEDFMQNQIIENLTSLFLNNFKNRVSQPILYVFISSLSSIFLYILISFFMGLSAWGFLFVPLVPFFRGFSIGLIQNYLYSQYGLKGLLFQIIVLFPGIFISSIAILLMAKESMLISQTFSNNLIFRSNSKCEKNVDLKDYIIKIGIILSLILLSVVVDISLNFLLLRFFNFG